MNAGKAIVINTAIDLLKENGIEIFGRLFIAMITQAAQERAVLDKKAVYCIVFSPDQTMPKCDLFGTDRHNFCVKSRPAYSGVRHE